MTGLLSLKGRPRRAAVLWVAAAVLLVAAGVWGALVLAERAAPIPGRPRSRCSCGNIRRIYGILLLERSLLCRRFRRPPGSDYSGGSTCGGGASCRGLADQCIRRWIRHPVRQPGRRCDFQQKRMEFDVAQAGGKTAVLGITALHGRYLAVTGNGTVLTSSDREQWQAETTPVRHDLISVASTGQMAMAVSAESDILLTRDGENWDTYNFNEMYEGLYPEYVFTSVTALGNSFFILGHTAEAPDTPLIMFSEDGSVWMHKELAAHNNECAGAVLSHTAADDYQ